MANLELTSLLGGVYQGRRVLVTGHTGFKGSWLSLWLSALGAEVAGLSLEPPSDPHHFALLDLDMPGEKGDLGQPGVAIKAVEAHQPEIIFHLAAQPLVRLSYSQAPATFQSNVMGTVHVLEAARQVGSVKAVVNITSDKCYENREWPWGYREIDRMGGRDPYSCSKGCAELITACFRQSFFTESGAMARPECLLASVRSGNVIGGGDWGADRLVPDLVKAAAAGESVFIRSPNATRPWQHVLDPLSGYLMVGWRLLNGRRSSATAWNFGPVSGRPITVGRLVEMCKEAWPKISYDLAPEQADLHEAGSLQLDCAKAVSLLGWRPVYSEARAIEQTMAWYKAYYHSGLATSRRHLEHYVEEAETAGLPWAAS